VKTRLFSVEGRAASAPERRATILWPYGVGSADLGLSGRDLSQICEPRAGSLIVPVRLKFARRNASFCSLGGKIAMLHKIVAMFTVGVALALNSISTDAVACGDSRGRVCRGGAQAEGVRVGLRGGRLDPGLGNRGYGFGPGWGWWAWPGDECHAWTPSYGYHWICYH
jgi:hypothetical protein